MTERERSLIVVMTPFPAWFNAPPGFHTGFLRRRTSGSTAASRAPSPRTTGAQSGFLSYGALLSAFSPSIFPIAAVRSTLRKVLSARFSCLASSTLVGEVLVLGANAATAAVLSLALRQLSLGPSAPSSPLAAPAPSTFLPAPLRTAPGALVRLRSAVLVAASFPHFPARTGTDGGEFLRSYLDRKLACRVSSRRAASSAAFFWSCFL